MKVELLSLLTSTVLAAQECQMMDGVNSYRLKRGRSTLKLDHRLMESAADQCKIMARYSTLGHSVDGSKPSGRALNRGYGSSMIAENVYEESGYGDPSYKRALKSWIESPGHEANLVGPYTRFGIADCRGQDGTIYWAQVFGAGDDRQVPVNCASGKIKEPKVETKKEEVVAPAVNTKEATPAENAKVDAVVKPAANVTYEVKKDDYGYGKGAQNVTVIASEAAAVGAYKTPNVVTAASATSSGSQSVIAGLSALMCLVIAVL